MAARWLAASTVLGRPVTGAEPYPHLCGRLLSAADSLSGRPVRLQRRDCAACAHERHQRTARQPDTAGGLLIDLDNARARRRAAA
ncbi:hypothetical protein E1211_03690 [Micromonospora sp. 15K316]|uniref:hypothetical protein n=1 Tax=Micromonospora sp. 15K316 TaxID=2530376 RepID=UPI00104C9206|nr:hypothetical protein [Micromonospora sp. 15K316]TDC39663.1 hypothetical protein E1211_03690 [Micromonospora sp. 15K316]